MFLVGPRYQTDPARGPSGGAIENENQFKWADSDHDESLDSTEFVKLQEPLLSDGKAKFMNLKMDLAFNSMDDNRDNAISPEELRPRILIKENSQRLVGKSLSEAKKAVADELVAISRDSTELFHNCDLDKSGKLGRQELSLFLFHSSDPESYKRYTSILLEHQIMPAVDKHQDLVDDSGSSAEDLAKWSPSELAFFNDRVAPSDHAHVSLHFIDQVTNDFNNPEHAKQEL